MTLRPTGLATSKHSLAVEQNHLVRVCPQHATQYITAIVLVTPTPRTSNAFPYGLSYFDDNQMSSVTECGGAVGSGKSVRLR
jgi:hypothetical protein